MEECRSVKKRLGEEKVENEDKDKDEEKEKTVGEKDKSCVIEIGDCEEKEKEDDEEFEEDEDTVIENICAISPTITVLGRNVNAANNDRMDSSDDGCEISSKQVKIESKSKKTSHAEDSDRGSNLPEEQALLFQDDGDKPKPSTSGSPSLSWLRKSPRQSKDKGSRKGSRKRTFPGKTRSNDEEKAGTS